MEEMELMFSFVDRFMSKIKTASYSLNLTFNDSPSVKFTKP